MVEAFRPSILVSFLYWLGSPNWSLAQNGIDIVKIYIVAQAHFAKPNEGEAEKDLATYPFYFSHTHVTPTHLKSHYET